jgi:hypothetical protein
VLYGVFVWAHRAFNSRKTAVSGPGSQLPGCATPTATSFNHTLRVGEGLRLFFFDSHGSPKTSRDGVTPRAIADYELLSATPAMQRQAAAGVVGLAYFHIPLCEYADESFEVIAGRIDALSAMRPEGYTGRMIGCPRKNTGLYDAMARQKNVRSVFVGHDHYHDAVMKRPGDEGPYICYGRLQRGYFVIMPPHIPFLWRIPIGTANVSGE